jgi:hypothetical protein
MSQTWEGFRASEKKYSLGTEGREREKPVEVEGQSEGQRDAKWRCVCWGRGW